MTNITFIFETSPNTKPKEKKVRDMAYYIPTVWKSGLTCGWLNLLLKTCISIYFFFVLFAQFKYKNYLWNVAIAKFDRYCSNGHFRGTTCQHSQKSWEMKVYPVVDFYIKSAENSPKNFRIAQKNKLLKIKEYWGPNYKLNGDPVFTVSLSGGRFTSPTPSVTPLDLGIWFSSNL